MKQEILFEDVEKRCGYTMISSAVIRGRFKYTDPTTGEERGLTDGAHRTYNIICSYAFGKSKTYPKISTLANIQAKQPRQIQYNLKALELCGLIRREFRDGKVSVIWVLDVPESICDDFIRDFIRIEPE